MKKLFILLLSSVVLLTACKKMDTSNLDKTDKESGEINNDHPLAVTGCNMPISASKDLITDFGAVGNGINDDSPAFLAAADWINNNWSPTSSIMLYIPPGVYRVGVQLAPNASYVYPGGTLTNNTSTSLMGFDLLRLNGVENVIIAGAGAGTQIVYHDLLFFGGINGAGTPVNHVPGASCHTSGAQPQHHASVGIFIKLTNSRCVRIEQMSIDGNAQNCKLAGKYNECNGYQLPYDGINIFGGNDIVVSGVTCKNFGRDGLMTYVSNGMNPVNIDLVDFESIANCRQGFSFCAGDNIQATNCKFNSAGSIFYNNPGCGIDIEPESGGTCINSSFSNCEIKDNAFCGMISDNHFPDVSNIQFNSCDIRATVPGSHALWPNRMINSGFLSCKIVGRIVHVAGTSSSDHMVFKNCDISDWNGSLQNYVSSWNQYLLDFGSNPPDDHYYSFISNTFNIHHSKLIFTTDLWNTYLMSDRTFENNAFYFHYADLQSPAANVQAMPTGAAGHLGNFKGCFLAANGFKETVGTSVAPPYSICYWIGITINYCGATCNPTYDNQTNGLNTWPQGNATTGYARVVRNHQWSTNHTFTYASPF